MEGISATQINERMVKVYGDSAPSYPTVAFCVWRFSCGQESLEDDPHPGVSATTTEINVKKVEEMVLEDRRNRTLAIE